MGFFFQKSKQEENELVVRPGSRPGASRRPLLNCVEQDFLFVAHRLGLSQDDPETRAQLFHVPQLEKFEAVVETLLLHDYVDELLLAVDANRERGVDLAPSVGVASVGCDVEDGAIDVLHVLANRALGQVRGVEPHEAGVAEVLAETLDGELELGQTPVLGRELGARQEPKVRRLRLLAQLAVSRGLFEYTFISVTLCLSMPK